MSESLCFGGRVRGDTNRPKSMATTTDLVEWDALVDLTLLPALSQSSSGLATPCAAEQSVSFLPACECWEGEPPATDFADEAEDGGRAVGGQPFLALQEDETSLTDVSQAPSRVSSPPCVHPRPSPNPQGALKKPRVCNVYDLSATDDKTRKRLLKNRASAEKSRRMRRERMHELEQTVSAQAEQIRRMTLIMEEHGLSHAVPMAVRTESEM